MCDGDVIEIKDTDSIADNGGITIDEIREASKYIKKEYRAPYTFDGMIDFIENLSKRIQRRQYGK